MSEASGSSEKIDGQSTAAVQKENSLDTFGQRQIFDPLRFPLQNGNSQRKEAESSTEIKQDLPHSPQKSKNSKTLSNSTIQSITNSLTNLGIQPRLEPHTNIAFQPSLTSQPNLVSQPHLITQPHLSSNKILTSQEISSNETNSTIQCYLSTAINLISKQNIPHPNLISQANLPASISCVKTDKFSLENNPKLPSQSSDIMNSQTIWKDSSQDIASFPSSMSNRATSSNADSGAIEYNRKSFAVDKSRDLKLSELEFCLPTSEIYEPETVDFPSSPTTFRTLDSNIGEVVRLAEGEAELGKSLEDQEDDDDKSLYTATANPPTGKVVLRKVERPKHLDMSHRKRLTVTEELLNICVDDDQQSVSSLSYHNSDDDDDDDAQMLSHDEFTDMLTPDDIDTPDELEESIMERLGPPQPPYEPHLEPSAERDSKDEKTWRAVILSGIERRIDMKVIEPYKKVLSHGGYMLGGNHEAIIVFSACFLPDRSRRDYDYVMDHLFMYVLTTLDTLIGEDYVLVYLHGATTRGNMPSFAWLKRCYQMIDRRLRKNLQGLYLVHPTFWVKTVVVMARPFVSSKFARKLRFISNLKELSSLIPLDQVCIPSRVKQYDVIRESLLQKKS